MIALRLLARRRFLPLFATQALGAFNDNLFRAAMLFLIAFRLAPGDPQAGAIAASLTGGVFILPYLLVSAPAGQWADRVDKARVARAVKFAEIAIMAVGGAGFALVSQPLLYAALFAMGVHSAVFGPVKYAILPQHLAASELIAGTALVEAATFLAILAGQIAGGLLPVSSAAAAMLGVAIVGWGASLYIPPGPPTGTAPRVDGNVVRGTRRVLAGLDTPALVHAVAGISWFFALGAVLTQQFVPLVAGLGGTGEVAAGALALFSIGVALGALWAARLGRTRALPGIVRAAAVALALLTAELAWSSAHVPPAPAATLGPVAFLRHPGGVRLAIDLLALAVAGGVYVVPLYAILQRAADPAARAAAVAANNIANAVLMIAVTLLALALLSSGAGPPILFAALALIGGLAALSARRI